MGSVFIFLLLDVMCCDIINYTYPVVALGTKVKK